MPPNSNNNVVQSRIASFEGRNEQVRGNINNNKTTGSSKDPPASTNHDGTKSSSTSMASASRINRLRPAASSKPSHHMSMAQLKAQKRGESPLRSTAPVDAKKTTDSPVAATRKDARAMRLMGIQQREEDPTTTTTIRNTLSQSSSVSQAPPTSLFSHRTHPNHPSSNTTTTTQQHRPARRSSSQSDTEQPQPPQRGVAGGDNASALSRSHHGTNHSTTRGGSSAAHLRRPLQPSSATTQSDTSQRTTPNNNPNNNHTSTSQRMAKIQSLKRARSRQQQHQQQQQQQHLSTPTTLTSQAQHSANTPAMETPGRRGMGGDPSASTRSPVRTSHPDVSSLAHSPPPPHQQHRPLSATTIPQTPATVSRSVAVESPLTAGSPVSHNPTHGPAVLPEDEDEADEEMTLTSVRQLLQPAPPSQIVAGQALPPSSQPSLSHSHSQLSSSQPQQQRIAEYYDDAYSDMGHGGSKSGNSERHHLDDNRRWSLQEESDKVAAAGGLLSSSVSQSRGMSSHSSAGSSEYDDDDDDDENALRKNPTQSSQATPDVASYFEETRHQRRQRKHHRQAAPPSTPTQQPHPPAHALRHSRPEDEEDNGSEGGHSVSYAQRRQLEEETRARQKAVAAAKKSVTANDFVSNGAAQTAAGVGVAATVGCLVLGPVGLLVGAAAVGIGVGVLQIPQEQRQNLGDKAAQTWKGVSDQALQATETLSQSCATTYHEYSGPLADHVPPVVESCFSGNEHGSHGDGTYAYNMDNSSFLGGENENTTGNQNPNNGINNNDQPSSGASIKGMGSRDQEGGNDPASDNHPHHQRHNSMGNSHFNPSTLNGGGNFAQGGGVGGQDANGLHPNRTSAQNNNGSSYQHQNIGNHPNYPHDAAGGAAMREAPVPVSQIYSLSPNDQPRAWLGVLASPNTTHDEKMEAMEEILILAKDKTRARLLVEEGILDSIMWTLQRYLEKNGTSSSSAPPEETRAAKVAAACCLRLGKAYCAAMHTDGDLMLMSLYERGSVPEERQLAQMLAEVPFHTARADDPELLELTQMSLPQAEEFAKSVKVLAEGRAY